MKFTYLVHSITTDNEQGLATGWLPGALSTEGIARAKSLQGELQSRPFDAVFSSDLYRAIQSTELFFEQKFPVFLDWRLRECNYGELDGTPAASFKKGHEQDFITTPYPGGECYKEVELRLQHFLRDLAQSGFQHVAVVAHQAPQLALEVLLHNKTWQEAIASDWRKVGAWQAGWEYRS